MASTLYAHDIVLNGLSLKVVRQPVQQSPGGGRTSSVDYIPQVSNQKSIPQLEPSTSVTWHRGSGATRKIEGATPATTIEGMNAWTRNGWTGDAGLFLPGPLVTVVPWPGTPGNGDIVSVEQDGQLYFFSGRYVARIPNGDPANVAVAEQDLGAFSAVGVKRWSGGFFVGGGASSTNIYKKASSLGPWTAIPLGSSRGYLETVTWTAGGLTGVKLVGTDGNTGIFYIDWTKDPSVLANWTPAGAIVIGTYPITSLVATRDHLYIPTTGGLFDLDATGLAPNLTPSVEQGVYPSNGVASLAHNGWIYYGHGYGLLRVRVANSLQYADIQDVTPKQGLPDESPVTGLPLAITRHNDWIILAQHDATAGAGGTSYISFGRESLGGYGMYSEKAFAGKEIGPMVWNCSPIVLPGYKVMHLHVSGLVTGSPRLWMGALNSAGAYVLLWSYLWQQSPYQDLLNGRTYRFAQSCDLYETFEDWGNDSMQKLVPEVALESSDLGAGSSVAISVKIDTDNAATPIGSLSAGPRSVLRPNLPLQGYRFQFIASLTGTPDAPAVLRKLEKRAIAQPDQREIRTYTVILGRAARQDGGTIDGLNPLQTRGDLLALNSNVPVLLRDEDGQNLTVLVTDFGKITETMMDVSGQNERYVTAQVQMMVLNTVAASMTIDGAGALDNSQWRLD